MIEVGDTVIMRKTGRENMYDVVKIFGKIESSFKGEGDVLSFYRQKPASTQYGITNVDDVLKPTEIKPQRVEAQLFKNREWFDVIEILKDVKDRVYYKIKNEEEMRVVHIDDINHFRGVSS